MSRHDWKDNDTLSVFTCRNCGLIGFAPHPLPEYGCLTPPTPQDRELDEVLYELANNVEWCVEVCGAPPVDRYRETNAINAAKQAILDWVSREVIGEDVTYEGHLISWAIEHQNTLRSNQRAILRQHGYKGE